MIVGNAAFEHKGLVEIDEVGIAAEGLGKEVGLEDGRGVLKGAMSVSLLKDGLGGFPVKIPSHPVRRPEGKGVNALHLLT